MIIPKKNRKIVYQYLFRGECRSRKTNTIESESAVPLAAKKKRKKINKTFFSSASPRAPGERSSLTPRFPPSLCLSLSPLLVSRCRCRGCHLRQEGLQPSGSPRDQGSAQPAGALKKRRFGQPPPHSRESCGLGAV